MSDHDFTRTTCDCAECVACCKKQPGPLVPSDLPRIQTFLGLTYNKLLPLLVASLGSLVLDTRTGDVRRIGSITPARKADGSCVFLDANDRCSIHPVAPFGCAYFDVHMDARTANPRSTWLARMTDTTLYQAIRALLKGASDERP
jgi:Fe-S-cluster containining protein